MSDPDADRRGWLDPQLLPNWLTYQPWDHDPIVAVDGHGRVMAQCACGWCGPDRTGDEHAAGLVRDDVLWHLDVVGGRL